MKKLALLMIFAASAHAGTATVTWTNPTAYTDGSALVPADISQTRVEYGSCAGAAFGTKAGEVIVTGSAATATVNNLAAGTYCFQAKTTAKGVESVASNVSSKVVPQSPPNPPVLVTVTTTAYQPRLMRGHFVMVAVGKVPLGTACGSQKLAGYNQIPAKAVTPAPRYGYAYGKCA